MRRRREEADRAHHAAASAWLHEMSAALDDRLVVDVRDVMPAPVLVATKAGDRRSERVRPLKARKLEAAT